MNDYKVIAALDDGVPISKHLERLIYVSFVFFTLPFVVMLIVLIAWAAGADVDGDGAVITFVSFFVIATLMDTLLIIVLKKNNALKKLIDLWLTDEEIIKTSAHSIEIDCIQNNGSMRESKILLRFFIDDVLYERESTSKNPFRPKGYSRVYFKYANKVIDILFSPKYNKILILESKKNNIGGKQ